MRELIAAGRLPAASAVDDAACERFPHDYFALLDDAGSVDALRDRFEARYVVAADTYGAIAGPDELDDAWYDYLAGRYGALLPRRGARERGARGPPGASIERLLAAPAPDDWRWLDRLARPRARARRHGAARRAGGRRRAEPARPPGARRARRATRRRSRSGRTRRCSAPAAARARRSKSSCSRRVSGPAVPSPIGAPSSAHERHHRLRGRGDEGLRRRRQRRRAAASAPRPATPSSRAQCRSSPRVTPASAPSDSGGVTSTPSTTANTLAASASATLPSGVSQSPVSAPAARAWARPTREAAVEVALTPAVGPSARPRPGQAHGGDAVRRARRCGRAARSAETMRVPPAVSTMRMRVSPPCAEPGDGVGHLGAQLRHRARDGERGRAGGEALEVPVERERHAAVGADRLVDAVAQQAGVEGGHGRLVRRRRAGR